MTRRIFSLCFLVVTASLLGCGDGRKPVYPVHGKVLINGKPATDAFVTLHAVTPDPNEPLFPSGQVDSQGAFALSSYITGDGAPAGDYVLTIEWLNYQVLGNQWGGPDKLKGRYSDPKKSKIQVRVENRPLELPPIELDA